MTEGNRVERRKARTRAALIQAAQGLLANGNTNAPVLEITQAADVSNGSFYNYFESKEELWQAAIDSALESVGDYLDSLTVGLEDPVEKFTQSFRLSGRLFRLEPQLSRVLLNSEAAAFAAAGGLAPRSRRDIESAAAQGRFDVDDPDVALAIVAGSLLSMGRLLLAQPDRDEASTVDGTTERVLRALGIPADEARKLCASVLPASYSGDVHAVVDPGNSDH
ncbi:TetR/AcrR family transcriptional regulator [Rhodococcus fascians]|nr:TetR/AcrR family transcriptional regulator [Rhodococcus fascians]MBY3999110.1 TetR/AcrR family transcriptional regulator [Rhodococcus fascians]MBY4000186.1 TetR/AcrR family transcriptional regulator [Rhodococcus fascians]MBY4005214.1 TetR/AcrR family transcriptional regulator [Rhodococcus fascians]MBY4016864.1 TetR/AcrR family transcriptional regulator [Rhodococcus fascians]